MINSRGQVVRSASKRFFLLPLILLFSRARTYRGRTSFRRRLLVKSGPILFSLLADDQCTYSMGCYGTPNVQTPNMDQLAQDGLVFDKHYDTTAICMASRVNISWVTGKYEYKAGCTLDSGPLLEEHWMESSHPWVRGRLSNSVRWQVWLQRPKTQRERVGYPRKISMSGWRSWSDELPDRSQSGYGSSMRKTIHTPRSPTRHSEEISSWDSAKQDRPFCLSISF